MAGILLGAASYYAPFFLVKAIIFILIVGALFRLFRGGRGRWRQFAFADRIRAMSDEEYSVFKTKYPGHCRPEAVVAGSEKK